MHIRGYDEWQVRDERWTARKSYFSASQIFRESKRAVPRQSLSASISKVKNSLEANPADKWNFFSRPANRMKATEDTARDVDTIQL